MGYLIGFAIAAVIVFYAVWILLAVIFRIFGFWLLYWLITLVAGLVAEILVGTLAPILALYGGRRGTPTAIASPWLNDQPIGAQTPKERLVWALKRPKGGRLQNLGWDPAWPVYNPYQSRLDRGSISTSGRKLASEPLSSLYYKIHYGGGSASTSKIVKTMRMFGRNAFTTALFIGLFTPFLISWWCGVTVATLGWQIIMRVIGFFIGLVQHTVTTARRRALLRTGTKAGWSLHCENIGCYRQVDYPAYKCPNSASFIMILRQARKEYFPGDANVAR